MFLQGNNESCRKCVESSHLYFPFEKMSIFLAVNAFFKLPKSNTFVTSEKQNKGC